MNLEDLILEEHSKSQALKLLKLVLSDKRIFRKYLQLILANKPIIAQRASWIMGDLAEQKPEWFVAHLNELLDHLNTKKHQAINRNITRAMQFISIPEDLTGKAYEICFSLMFNRNESIACRVNCMTVLQHIAQQYPDLIAELKKALSIVMVEDVPAFTARGKMVLKALNALKI